MSRLKIITTLLLLAVAPTAFAQTCDCPKNLTHLQQQVETNQASYQHQVVEMNRTAAYTQFKNHLNQQAARAQTPQQCLGLIAVYLGFFRDEHAFLAYAPQYAPPPNPKARPRRPAPPQPHDGRWYFQDGSFSVTVMPAPTLHGERVAVMHHDDTRKWPKGQVKIEFFEDEHHTPKCIYWRQNRVPQVHEVTFTDSTMKIGRRLTFYRRKPSTPPPGSLALPPALAVTYPSATTSYLRIPSFDLTYTAKIDSALKKNAAGIAARPYLILDVRGNGGGGFDAFKPLLPLLLDKPVMAQPYYGSVWVSPDNLAYYDRTKYDYAPTRQDSTTELAYVASLRPHLGRFSPVEKLPDTIALAAGFPHRVGLLFDRYSASSTEGLLLTCRQSAKVRTFGEPSAGAVSYGDWRPIELPGLHIWLALTTKKMVFETATDFESIGIAPDVDLTAHDEREWLHLVRQELERD
ncbi:S41 family peptidase [Hymenobacter aranciens]|nr:S41 family peptidase [Hymenobacter sp. ASUV-10]